jgi:hypothetical protein
MDQPTSKLARAAFAKVEAGMSPTYFAHSLRTYGCAAAFAKRRKLTFDDEGLYVASLYHDVGLFEPWRNAQKAFQLVSGEHLRAFLEEHKVDADRIARLVASIEYHVLPLPRWSLGNDVGLLHVGAWMDALSWRRWTVAEEAARLETEFPRGPFIKEAVSVVAKSVRSPSALMGMLLPDWFKEKKKGT